MATAAFFTDDFPFEAGTKPSSPFDAPAASIQVRVGTLEQLLELNTKLFKDFGVLWREMRKANQALKDLKSGQSMIYGDVQELQANPVFLKARWRADRIKAHSRSQTRRNSLNRPDLDLSRLPHNLGLLLSQQQQDRLPRPRTQPGTPGGIRRKLARPEASPPHLQQNDSSEEFPEVVQPKVVRPRGATLEVIETPGKPLNVMPGQVRSGDGPPEIELVTRGKAASDDERPSSPLSRTTQAQSVVPRDCVPSGSEASSSGRDVPPPFTGGGKHEKAETEGRKRESGGEGEEAGQGPVDALGSLVMLSTTLVDEKNKKFEQEGPKKLRKKTRSVEKNSEQIRMERLHEVEQRKRQSTMLEFIRHAPYGPTSESLEYLEGWKRWRQVGFFIFHDENYSKKAFLMLMFILGLIFISTLAYVLESIPALADYTEVWFNIEMVVTALFTVEYVSRLIIVRNRCQYMRRLMNLIDLFAILPFYLEVAFPGMPTQTLRVLRVVRLARIARLRNLFSAEVEVMSSALGNAMREAGPMMCLMLIVETVLFGSIVYAFENGAHNDENGVATAFISIPEAMWWTFVTITTVGYGDMSPKTVPGRLFGVICMLSGIVLMSIVVIIIGGNFDMAHQAYLQEHDAEYANKPKRKRRGGKF